MTLTMSFLISKANIKILFPEESNFEVVVSKDKSTHPPQDQALVVRVDLSKTLLEGKSSKVGAHALELLYEKTAYLLQEHLSNASKRAVALRIAQAREEENAEKAKREDHSTKKTQELQDHLAEMLERMARLEDSIIHLQDHNRPLTPSTTTIATEAAPTEWND